MPKHKSPGLSLEKKEKAVPMEIAYRKFLTTEGINPILFTATIKASQGKATREDMANLKKLGNMDPAEKYKLMTAASAAAMKVKTVSNEFTGKGVDLRVLPSDAKIVMDTVTKIYKLSPVKIKVKGKKKWGKPLKIKKTVGIGVKGTFK